MANDENTMNRPEAEWILCENQDNVDNDNNNYAYYCTRCHHQDVHSKYCRVSYCWNCGAYMKP